MKLYEKIKEKLGDKALEVGLVAGVFISTAFIMHHQKRFIRFFFKELSKEPYTLKINLDEIGRF